MAWVNTSGWTFNNNRISSTGGPGSTRFPLIYRMESEKTFSSRKNYLVKTKVALSNNFIHPDDDNLTIKLNWSNNFRIFGIDVGSYNDNEGYVYSYSSPNNTISTNEPVNYFASTTFVDPNGIIETEIHEIEWSLFGHSWIANDDFSSLPGISGGQLLRSTGWIYDTNTKSYFWFDTNYTNSGFSLINNVASNNRIIPLKEINHMSRFIDYQFFNLKFSLEKSVFTSSNDTEAGVKIYLSSNDPYSGNSIPNFQEYLDNSEFLSEIKDDDEYEYYGLLGNRYLIIVADTASENTSTQIKISNISIEGGYHPSNNQVYDAQPSSGLLFGDSLGLSVVSRGIVFSAPNLEGATYSFFVGTGNSSDDNITGITISSKIGNGRFQSGIWENGTWNSGWRKDTDIRELYDIIRSIKIKSDSLWRIRISGLTTDIEDLNIGDKIAIGNIIAIDINDNRNVLNDYYSIINKGEIDQMLSFIEVDINVTFPMRRIEKDSENHRIKITRNVWKSGVFLNGYFEGVWNDGLFRGYPLITEMNNTNWIDGRFDGGHFISNKYISGTFSETFRDDSSVPAKLGLSFSENHNVKVGDIIDINIDSINSSRYNGESTVIKVIDSNSFVTDKNYGLFVPSENGSFTTELATGLIQNMRFNSNNVSNITSVDSLASSSVFIYNSWIDVVYNDDSAVNIGKPQNIIDTISRNTYSENNLYGYPTNDVLSSISRFRDSYSNNERNYTLGNKYKIYEDYVGDSSKFTEFFGPTGPDAELLLKQGWTFSKDRPDSITFSRSESLGQDSVLGEELKVNSKYKGGVLDIGEASVPTNRSKIELTRDKYSIIEFDIIRADIEENLDSDYGNISDGYYNIIPAPGSKISPQFVEPDENTSDTLLKNRISDGLYELRKEPLIHFNNLNFIKREFTETSFLQVNGNNVENRNVYELESTFLPIYKNVDHISTKRKKKVEYFYNKRNLSMNFRGNGFFGNQPSEYTINNIKLYEVNMIPFFQYFTDININKSAQVPLQGISPYIFFNRKDTNIVDKSGIGFNSFEILPSNEFLLPLKEDLLSDD